MTTQRNHKTITFTPDDNSWMQLLAVVEFGMLAVAITDLFLHKLVILRNDLVLMIIFFVLFQGIVSYTYVTIDDEHVRTRTLYFLWKNTIPHKAIHRIEVDTSSVVYFQRAPVLVFHTKAKRYEYNVGFYGSSNVIGQILAELKRRNPAIELDANARYYLKDLQTRKKGDSSEPDVPNLA